ncbi:MAG: hypothetical protein R2874_07840 [Desulfobacterales bacterium]
MTNGICIPILTGEFCRHPALIPRSVRQDMETGDESSGAMWGKYLRRLPGCPKMRWSGTPAILPERGRRFWLWVVCTSTMDVAWHFIENRQMHAWDSVVAVR